MSIWALVPVKPIKLAKSRLAGVLSPREREELNRGFLRQTLAVVTRQPRIERTMVVSRDPAALAVAREYGARTLMEEGAPLLNLALTRATIVAQSYGVFGLLVVHADLPLLTAEEIDSMLCAGSRGPGVVIAPDRHEGGTNALLVSPPGLIQYAFGPGSFAEHLRRAQEAGAKVIVCRLPGLSLDIDVPEDLELYRSRLAAAG